MSKIDKSKASTGTMSESSFYKENYYKYPRVRSALIADLEAEVPAKESAKKLGISEQTYYKYKGLVSCELGKIFIVPEEKTFLERHKQPAAMSSQTAPKTTRNKSKEKTS
jgi:hypothetical protein